MDLETMLFLCMSIKKIPKSHETVPLRGGGRTASMTISLVTVCEEQCLFVFS
jgi:hypothetical protein